MFDARCRVAIVFFSLSGLLAAVRAPAGADDTIQRPKIVRNSIGMSLTLIAPGKFLMGSPITEVDRNKYTEPHEVEITRAFYMGVYPVTVSEFRAFVRDTGYKTEAEVDGKGGSGYNRKCRSFHFTSLGDGSGMSKYTWRRVGWKQGRRHPVVNVSWNDAVKFCEWLSRKEGAIYRLPTEAEWEYACRAGSKTRFYSGDDEASLSRVANIADACLQKRLRTSWDCQSWNDGYPFTSPVGRFQPNNWGLYDMHGNVAQWCNDYWDLTYYQYSAKQDPHGPDNGTCRVIRGAGFFSAARWCSAANRCHYPPQARLHSLGFRVVREIEGE